MAAAAATDSSSSESIDAPESGRRPGANRKPRDPVDASGDDAPCFCARNAVTRSASPVSRKWSRAACNSALLPRIKQSLIAFFCASSIAPRVSKSSTACSRRFPFFLSWPTVAGVVASSSRLGPFCGVVVTACLVPSPSFRSFPSSPSSRESALGEKDERGDRTPPSCMSWKLELNSASSRPPHECAASCRSNVPARGPLTRPRFDA
mmetsp:Transcript_17320/g.52705  ORF Transcript_17320/g.52705 Transcript_17320/m.52705 type:complete len:207 (+) Transcript_17320:147-767(+)